MKNRTYSIYTKSEEICNAWSHLFGIALGVIAGFFLIKKSLELDGIIPVISIIIYLLGMLGSYVTSTLYHSTRFHNRWRPRFRQLDHAAIYWHIAGSYSPIALIPLINAGAWGWSIFSFVWTFAIIGTLVCFRKIEKHSYVETICFIIMGLTVCVALKPMFQYVPMTSIRWIFWEGVCFITGAAFYSLHSLRYMHCVFHFFVLGGSICHILSLWYMI